MKRSEKAFYAALARDILERFVSLAYLNKPNVKTTLIARKGKTVVVTPSVLRPLTEKELEKIFTSESGKIKLKFMTEK